MKYPKGLIGKLDRAFSKYIRIRDKWTCQRCKKKYPENARGLHCSHYMGRTNKATRWDKLNCDALCHGCHSYFEDRKQTEYRDWMVDRLGEDVVNAIERKSRLVVKYSQAELKEMLDYYKDRIV